MYLSLFLTFIYFVGGVVSNSLFSPCKKSDIPCIENSVNAALPKIFDGIPELGIEKSDPQFVELIEGNLSILKFKLYNSTLNGYKNCKISNMKINEDVTNVHCEVLCKPLNMSGQYEMKGRLITLPIEGEGDYEFVAGSYFVNLEAKLEKVKGNNGESHFFIKKIIAKAKPLSPIKFNFQNLFNGRTELAAVVKKFAQENWLEITELLQDPIWTASLDLMTTNLNKYLKTIAIDDSLLS